MSDFGIYPLLPTYVELETSTYCNRTCTWCPNGDYDRGRTQTLIDDNLFNKIVGDIKKAGFTGTIALHNYNEPLYDPKLKERIHVVNQELEARIAILTNGDILTLEKVMVLDEAGVDFLRVTLYWAIKLDPTSSQITAYCESIGLNSTDRRHDEFGVRIKGRIKGLDTEVYVPNINRFTNRAGAVAGFGDGHGDCFLPFNSCAIDYQGNMKICCEVYPVIPAHNEFGIVGNLRESSFAELWFSETMNKLRKEILTKTNTNPLCNTCGLKVKNAKLKDAALIEQWKEYLESKGE